MRLRRLLHLGKASMGITMAVVMAGGKREGGSKTGYDFFRLSLSLRNAPANFLMELSLLRRTNRGFPFLLHLLSLFIIHPSRAKVFLWSGSTNLSTTTRENAAGDGIAHRKMEVIVQSAFSSLRAKNNLLRYTFMNGRRRKSVGYLTLGSLSIRQVFLYSPFFPPEEVSYMEISPLFLPQGQGKETKIRNRKPPFSRRKHGGGGKRTEKRWGD